MPPKPRHRDRRAGAATATFRRALRGSGDDGSFPEGPRRSDRESALKRFRDRYNKLPTRILLLCGALLCLSGYLTMTAVFESRHHAPLESNRADYADLITALQDACPEGTCSYGIGMDGRGVEKPTWTVEPHMSRLRLSTALYDNLTAEARVSGRRDQGELVYRVPGATPEQEHIRSRRHAFLDRTRSGAERQLEALGGGWFAVR